MAIYDNINRLQRIDNLIRMQATGSPETLARKLGISVRMLYNDISTMKLLGAPILYNQNNCTYYYAEEGKTYFGFYTEELTDYEKVNISGGFFFDKTYIFFSDCNNIAV